MRSRGVLCLGEVLVDLICERPVSSSDEVDALVPHFGGATANVAVSAAKHGARVGLAGTVGRDHWGLWLRERLTEEGVDLRWFHMLEGVATAMAIVVVDAVGEPCFTIYGESFDDCIAELRPEIDRAVSAFDALFLGSNTLVGSRERAVSNQARRAALERGAPVMIDANLRLDRWADPRDAATAVLDLVPGSLLIRTNQLEAEILTSRSDPMDQAKALAKLGASAVVVTLGSDGAFLATEGRVLRAPGIDSTVRSTVGAGDAFTGVLLAALDAADFQPGALFEALPRAVAEGALAAERWGAVDN
jgi:fructokinase